VKVRVTYKTPDISVDEVFQGPDCEAVVAAMQKAVAGRLNFALRLFVNAMSPTAFAQEVVSRYNAAMKKSVPRPASCEEFVRLGVEEGIVTVLED
jgi:hypothetical protein